MQPSDAAEIERGIALFNQREFHAAHEAWESAWLEADGARRDWLQGLIQYAAALFHVERGYHASGFVKLMRSAREKVAAYDGSGEALDTAALARDLEPWHAHARRVAEGWPLRRDLPPFPVLEARPRAGESSPADEGAGARGPG